MSAKPLSEVQKQEVRTPGGTEPTRPRKAFVPRADIVETPGALLVTVDMPGVDEAAVDITVDRNLLALHGTAAAAPPAGYTLAYAEYEMGDWHREFVLPDEVKRDAIQAILKNGVLRLTLPKADPARKIQVRAE